jgi:hypothetical protein
MTESYKGIRVNDIYQFIGSDQYLIIIGISGRDHDTRDIHTKIHYRYLNKSQETHWAYYTHFLVNFNLLENK